MGVDKAWHQGTAPAVETLNPGQLTELAAPTLPRADEGDPALPAIDLDVRQPFDTPLVISRQGRGAARGGDLRQMSDQQLAHRREDGYEVFR